MHVLVGNGFWMVWNLLLALVAPVLGIMLFRRQGWSRSPFWWLGAAVFVVFLPNAPYVVTDLIHLPSDAVVVRGHDALTVSLFVQYSLFVVAGIVSYAVSIECVRRYLRRCGWSRAAVLGLEWALHALCAVGVLLGRYARFNSWDLGVRPSEVLAHLGSRVNRPFSWMLLVATFALLLGCTFAARTVAAGLAAVFRRPPPFLRS